MVPKYLGDVMVILLGFIDTKAKELAKEETRHGSTLFHSLEKWNPNMRTGHRLVWAHCWGIPLVAWEMVQIRKIVAAIGDLVEVDDDVEELRRLDRTRVLIRTPWSPTLLHTVNIHIGGEIYKVHIVEENGNGNGNCSCQPQSTLGSSEEIDSGDSNTGTSISKLLGAPGTDYAPRRTTDNSTGGVVTKGNLLLSNGPSADEVPVGNNLGRLALCTNHKTSMLGMGAGNGTKPVAQPRLETVVCCEKEGTCRAQKQ